MENTTKQSLKQVLVWILLLLALVGTFVLSRKLENDIGNSAAVFLGGMRNREVQIYGDRAVPDLITARVGDEIVFKIMDEGFHNIAAERNSQRGVRLESGELGNGDSYILSFSNPGSYSFYDRMNFDIHVTINIEK